MAKSQNGWPVQESSRGLEPLSWVTGRVLPGDVHAIFDYLGSNFDRLVEKIDRASSWGYSYRPIAGSKTLSNHASGTAVDFNAPRHPMGKKNTFNATQVRSIRSILATLESVVRWGGDFSRADDMHFEINSNAANVKRVADKIRSWSNDTPSIPVPPKTEVIPESETEMLLFRNEKNGAVVLLNGGKVFIIEGAALDTAPLTNLSSILGAGVKLANVTESQFNRIMQDGK